MNLELGILTRARALISDESRWTTEYSARTADGKQLENGDDPDAVCWCAWGAVYKTTKDMGLQLGEAIKTFCFLDKVSDRLHPEFRNDNHTVDVNDSCGHAETLRVFDAAIAELEGAAPPPEGSEPK